MGKVVARGMLAVYLAILIWLVLFKFSFNISSVLAAHRRSLNLFPFAAPSMVNGGVNFSEIVYNCLFFIPFGLLLQVNFKNVGFLPKLASIMVYSLALEAMQYTFAIGSTDITDVITNTVGGFLGLAFYGLCSRYGDQKKLDRAIVSLGVVLLVIFIAMIVTRFGPFRARGIR